MSRYTISSVTFNGVLPINLNWVALYNSTSNILYSFADDIGLIVGVSTASSGALILIGALTFFLVRRRKGFKPNENGTI